MLQVSDAGSPPSQTDWDAIYDVTGKKLVARWPRVDTSTVRSAAGYAVAIVYAMNENKVPIEDVPALVWQIAFNTIYAEQAKAHNRNEVTNHDFELDVERWACSPLEIILKEEFHQALQEAIKTLPDSQRVPFLEHIVNEKSYDEIAKETGLKSGTLRNNVSTAKATVRAKLKKQGYHGNT